MEVARWQWKKCNPVCLSTIQWNLSVAATEASNCWWAQNNTVSILPRIPCIWLLEQIDIFSIHIFQIFHNLMFGTQCNCFFAWRLHRFCNSWCNEMSTKKEHENEEEWWRKKRGQIRPPNRKWSFRILLSKKYSYYMTNFDVLSGVTSLRTNRFSLRSSKFEVSHTFPTSK